MVVGARLTPAPAIRLRSPITGGTDEFDQTIASFAVSYAEQNDEDYAVFKSSSNPATSLAEPLNGQPNGRWRRGLSEAIAEQKSGQ